jgi:type IV pilus assembly protein PilC
MRSLAALIGSGTPLNRALQVTIDQCRERRFSETLRSIASEVDGGASLSEAMRRRPLEFSEHLVAMISAGELGGILDDVLQRAATLLEKEDTLRRQVIAAVAYPAFVLCCAFGLVTFLLMFTVPAFASILAQLHASLPLSTRVMLEAGAIVRSPATWAFGVPGTLAAVFVIIALRRRKSIAVWIDRKSLDLPVLGNVQRSANIAAFSRTIGTLLECGVVITDAVRTASNVVTNSAYRLAAEEIEHSLHAGMAFSPLLERSGLFDAMALEMASVGEESGTLDAMLVRVSEHHEAAAASALTTIGAALEPALILALGGVVGGIVASILIPLYSAIGSIR